MTMKERNTKLSSVKAVAGDRDQIKALMKEALQEVLEGEMTEFLCAEPGERTEARSGYRAGYYGRSLVTWIGKLELRASRDRCGEFSTALFERYALRAPTAHKGSTKYRNPFCTTWRKQLSWSPKWLLDVGCDEAN